MTALFAVLDAVFIAFNNVAAGAAGRARSVVSVLAVASPVSLLCVLAATAAVPGTASTTAVLWGAVAGLVGAAGLFLAYRAFALGPVGAASAGAQCTATLVVTLTGAAVAGSLAPQRSAGLVVCLVAVVLVCRPDRRVRRQVAGPLLGVAAGALFGAFVVLAGQAPAGAGLWTVLAARVAVCAVVATAAVLPLVRRGATGGGAADGPRGWRGPGLGLAALAGATDGLANVFLALALRGGDLVLVGLVGTLAPAVAALLGRYTLGDRLSRGQVVGLLLAVLGAAAAVV